MSLLDVEGDFGLSMLQHSSDSFIASPASALMALGLLFLGSMGNTKDQLRNAIGKGFADSQITDNYSSLSKTLLKNVSGIETSVANRIYINQDFCVKPAYLQTIQQKYDAFAQTLNFDDSQAAADIVNEFVSEVTKGKIPNLVDSSAFSNGAVAVLVNAIYMKAQWARQFQKSATKQANFKKASNSVTKVMYMAKYNEDDNLYYEDSAVQVLTLPYKDPSFAFTIFLPQETYGLSTFISTLTGSKLQSLLKSTLNTTVTMKIPKLAITSDIDLKGILVSLGVTDLFTKNANLSGIANNITVSSAIQKALIETDEEGSVAAAATAIGLGGHLPMAPPPSVQFFADHPFLFTITFNGHGLFIGTFFG